jgi:two-component system CheB/CheR fusion protein
MMTSSGSGTTPRLTVGVGASAGGLEAFQRLLASLPDRTGMAFLLVQHLSPTRPSALAEQLSRRSRIRVVEAADGALLEPDTAYAIRPGTVLAVRDGRIALTTPVDDQARRRPVDHLFRSLAREFGPRAVGIVLSGAGSDGSAGLRDIKAAGGLTIAQTPATSGQPGMPQRAIGAGVVDFVLEVDEMPGALERFSRLPHRALVEPPQADEGRDALAALTADGLARVAAALQGDADDLDLGIYKPGTLERRILRRMTLSNYGTIETYLTHLREDRGERQALRRDLLINVTEFFRDPEAFDALRQEVVEPLVASAAAGSTLRVWVPGCATGEEALSIGMEFLDAIEARDRHLYLRLFATDVDPDVVAVGRAGVYSPGVAERLPSDHLRRHFVRVEPEGYQVTSPLRDAVSFAVHDLARDPPFSKMDLVSCRNVLIYLRPEMQAHVLKLLHFALNPDRHLFLGTSETAGPVGDLFGVVSEPQRLYRKLGRSQPLSITRTKAARPQDANGQARPPMELAARVAARPMRHDDRARRAVMHAFVPPAVVVAADGTAIFMHGELRPYLRFPEGDDPKLEVAALVAPELTTRTRAVLYQCRKEGRPVAVLSSFEHDAPGRVRITATPAPGAGQGAVILTFEPVAEPGAAAAEPAGPADAGRIHELEKELDATREDLHQTVEELETTNEQLRTANEESTSMNEEFQAANEELEATAEELRSLNEELTTVNGQLRDKVAQLEQAHNDLGNFFGSTKIATLFLDDGLRIKRFTPAAEELLRIGEPDVDRPVGHIARELLQSGLEDDAREVLAHLSPRERELHTGERWTARTVRPYRTVAGHVEGVVVTFVDVTALKSATERLARRERQHAVIARLGLAALEEPDLQGFMNQTVREVRQTLETDLCKLLELQPGRQKLFLRAGIGWDDGLVGSAHVRAGSNSQAGYTLRAGEPVIVDDLPGDDRFTAPRLLEDHGVVSGLSSVIRHGEGEYGVIGAHSTTRRTFTQEDANFLQAVAGIIGSAVNRQQTRLRLALERGVTRALADAHTRDDAIRKTLACLTREMRTSVGELWWADDDRTSLSCRLATATAVPDREDVVERLTGVTVPAGQGVVGRVFTRARAVWMTEFRDRAEFERLNAGQELGVVTGVALPIVAAGQVLGVLTAFSTGRVFAGAVLLRSLESLGRAIGEFVVRLDTEAKARRMAAITASSHDAILGYDFDGRITEWLGGAESLYGYTAEEMIGAPVERLIPEDRRDEARAATTQIRGGQVVEAMETVRLDKSGRRLEVSVRMSPIRDRRRRLVGISSSDRDVTRHKDTERRLVEADRQKDEFLAMLGHELRNPLAAVRSAAEVIKAHAGQSPELQRTQAILERQSTHMAKLLDGLLDVSRIIRGKIAIETDVVDLVEICREVAEDVRERVTTDALEFAVDLPSEPVWVDGDRVRLTQVLDNLLSNASKYTERGSIALTLGREGSSAVISVRDTGAGIEPQLLPNIFGVFRQARQTLDRARGGLGLGLALVKSLVEMHRGTVDAFSEGRDRGAEFVVRLPTTRKTRPRARPVPSDGPAPLRILVVEDNDDVAVMLREVLRRGGHHVDLAARGEDGVALARTSPPDVVLCDLGLPGTMTGFDVARALRSDPGTRDIRLIAVSGYSRPEDKKGAIDAGFDGHIAKPVDAKALGRLLNDMPRTKTRDVKS